MAAGHMLDETSAQLVSVTELDQSATGIFYAVIAQLIRLAARTISTDRLEWRDRRQCLGLKSDPCQVSDSCCGPASSGLFFFFFFNFGIKKWIILQSHFSAFAAGSWEMPKSTVMYCSSLNPLLHGGE